MIINLDVIDTSLIPPGDYCYSLIKVDAQSQRLSILTCPYWSKRSDKLEYMNGYCAYLKCGDWEDDRSGLLWDMVKECSVGVDTAALLDGHSISKDEWTSLYMTWLRRMLDAGLVPEKLVLDVKNILDGV